MANHASLLRVQRLGKRKMAAVVQRARRLGMTPQGYIKHLVEEDLAISDRAKSTSFSELVVDGQTVDEAELDKLVEAARVDYHKVKSRKG